MTKTPVRSLVVALGCLTALGACGKDDGTTVPLRIDLYAAGASGLPSFPDRVASNVQTLEVTSYQGSTLIDQRVFDVGELDGTLPTIPFGDDVWVSVEAMWENPACVDTCITARNGTCEDGGRSDQAGAVDATAATCLLGTDCVDCGLRSTEVSRLASGATPRFSVDADSAQLRADVLMNEPTRFEPAYRIDLDAGSTPTSLYELEGQGRAGFAMAQLPDSGAVLLVGGANLDPTSPARLEETNIIGMRDTIQWYDPETGSFYVVYDADRSGTGAEAALRLPNGVAFGTATALDEEHVLIFGGLQATTAGAVSFLEASSQAYLLTLTNFAEGRLEAVTVPTAGGRAFHTASLVDDGTVLIAGGIGGTYNQPFFQATVDIATFRGGEVTVEPAITQLNTPRALHTASFIPDQDHGVILIGGRSAQGLAQTSEVLFLDGSGTLQREVLTGAGDIDLTQPRFGHQAVTYRCPNDPDPYVAVVGGYTATGTGMLSGSTPTNTVEVYVPMARFDEDFFRFEEQPSVSLSTGRAFASVTTLPLSADLLVVGGLGPDGTPLSSAERLYNTNWNLCSVLEGGPVPQYGLTAAHAMGEAVVLPSQLVLVTGGFDGARSVDTSSYYNADDFYLIQDYY